MRKRLARLLIAAVALSIAVSSAGCSPLGATERLSGNYVKNIWGPDVSNYQHPRGKAINWSGVAHQGAKFAFVKMSEGSSYRNPWAATDLRGARGAGLFVSAYHFGRPRLPLSTATTDARAFAAQLGNVRQLGYLPPVLDLEVTGGLSAANVTAWTRRFLSALQAGTGRVPMIYSGAWFWKGYLHNPTGFAQYPVWVAQYTPHDTGPNLFGDFAYSTFWQYSDTALVTGISGRVDVSWFHGTLAQLTRLAYIPVTGRSTQSARALIDTVTAASPGSQTSGTPTTGAKMAEDHALVSSR